MNMSIPHPDGAAKRLRAPSGCLSFRLGQDEYGIDILKLQEIRGHDTPMHIAGAASFVTGLVDLDLQIH